MSFRLPNLVSEIKKSVNQISNAVVRKGGDKKYIQAIQKGKIQEYRQNLYSNNKEKKKNTVKKIIACITVGKDVSMLFPDVVNCVQTNCIELKKLVYLYIINYASCQPELAILAVNTFRKDSLDDNPLIRGLAIRTMGYIYLPQIMEYLIDPLKKAANDSNDYVRKTAAICIRKVFEISPKIWYEYDFMSLLKEMISDTNPSIVYNALLSFVDIAETFEVNFFTLDTTQTLKILENLHFFSEWGQICVLDIIHDYYTPDPSMAKTFLEMIIPRINHINAAVVFATVRLILKLYECLSDNDTTYKDGLLAKVVSSLISTLVSPYEIQYVILRNLILLIEKFPHLFKNEIKTFYCRYTDPVYIKLEKLTILIILLDEDNYNEILSELQIYTNEVDVYLIREAIRSVGECAVKLKMAAPKAVSILMKLINTGSNDQLDESIIAMQQIYREYPYQMINCLNKIYKKFNEIKSDEARLAAIWVFGEYAEKISGVTECFINLINDFSTESDTLKHQILQSSVKVFFKYPNEFQPHMQNLFLQAIDKSNDIDLIERAFFYWRSLSSNPELLKKIVLNIDTTAFQNTCQKNDDEINRLLKLLTTASSVFHLEPEYYIDKSLSSSAKEDSYENLGKSIARNEFNDDSTIAQGEKSNTTSNKSSSMSKIENLLDFDHFDVVEVKANFPSTQLSTNNLQPSGTSQSFNLLQFDDFVSVPHSNIDYSASLFDDSSLIPKNTSNNLASVFLNISNSNNESDFIPYNYKLLYPDVPMADGKSFLRVLGYLNVADGNCLKLMLRFEYTDKIPSIYLNSWQFKIKENYFGFKFPFQESFFTPKQEEITEDISLLLSPNQLSKTPNLILPLTLDISVVTAMTVMKFAPIYMELSHVFQKNYTIDKSLFWNIWNDTRQFHEKKITGSIPLSIDISNPDQIILNSSICVIDFERDSSKLKLSIAAMAVTDTMVLTSIDISTASRYVVIHFKSANVDIINVFESFLKPILKFQEHPFT